MANIGSINQYTLTGQGRKAFLYFVVNLICFTVIFWLTVTRIIWCNRKNIKQKSWSFLPLHAILRSHLVFSMSLELLSSAIFWGFYLVFVFCFVMLWFLQYLLRALLYYYCITRYRIDCITMPVVDVQTCAC